MTTPETLAQKQKKARQLTEALLSAVNVFLLPLAAEKGPLETALRPSFLFSELYQQSDITLIKESFKSDNQHPFGKNPGGELTEVEKHHTEKHKKRLDTFLKRLSGKEQPPISDYEVFSSVIERARSPEESSAGKGYADASQVPNDSCRFCQDDADICDEMLRHLPDLAKKNKQAKWLNFLDSFVANDLVNNINVIHRLSEMVNKIENFAANTGISSDTHFFLNALTHFTDSEDNALFRLLDFLKDPFFNDSENLLAKTIAPAIAGFCLATIGALAEYGITITLSPERMETLLELFPVEKMQSEFQQLDVFFRIYELNLNDVMSKETKNIRLFSQEIEDAFSALRQLTNPQDNIKHYATIALNIVKIKQAVYQFTAEIETAFLDLSALDYQETAEEKTLTWDDLVQPKYCYTYFKRSGKQISESEGGLKPVFQNYLKGSVSFEDFVAQAKLQRTIELERFNQLLQKRLLQQRIQYASPVISEYLDLAESLDDRQLRLHAARLYLVSIFEVNLDHYPSIRAELLNAAETLINDVSLSPHQKAHAAMRLRRYTKNKNGRAVARQTALKALETKRESKSLMERAKNWVARKLNGFKRVRHKNLFSNFRKRHLASGDRLSSREVRKLAVTFRDEEEVRNRIFGDEILWQKLNGRDLLHLLALNTQSMNARLTQIAKKDRRVRLALMPAATDIIAQQAAGRIRIIDLDSVTYQISPRPNWTLQRALQNPALVQIAGGKTLGKSTVKEMRRMAIGAGVILPEAQIKELEQLAQILYHACREGNYKKLSERKFDLTKREQAIEIIYALILMKRLVAYRKKYGSLNTELFKQYITQTFSDAQQKDLKNVIAYLEDLVGSPALAELLQTPDLEVTSEPLLPGSLKDDSAWLRPFETEFCDIQGRLREDVTKREDMIAEFGLQSLRRERASSEGSEGSEGPAIAGGPPSPARPDASVDQKAERMRENLTGRAGDAPYAVREGEGTEVPEEVPEEAPGQRPTTPMLGGE